MCPWIDGYTGRARVASVVGVLLPALQLQALAGSQAEQVFAEIQ
jgi:hypothetical protein